MNYYQQTRETLQKLEELEKSRQLTDPEALAHAYGESHETVEPVLGMRRRWVEEMSSSSAEHRDARAEAERAAQQVAGLRSLLGPQGMLWEYVSQHYAQRPDCPLQFTEGSTAEPHSRQFEVLEAVLLIRIAADAVAQLEDLLRDIPEVHR